MTQVNSKHANDRRHRLVRALFVLGGLGALGGLAYVATAVSPVLAIKGGYVLLALPVGWFLYRTREGTGLTANDSDVARWCGKGVAVVVLVSVGVVFGFGARLVVLAIAIPVGYVLLLAGSISGSSAKSTLAQACGLFVLDPLSKHVSTGFYFGNGDTLAHVGAITALVRAGDPAAIDPLYSGYGSIPGMHLSAGTMHLLTGLNSYESLVGTVMALYAIGIVCVYLLARSLLEERLATGIAVGLSFLAPVHYFAAYAFPQSFATVLVIAVIYATYRAARGSDRTRRRFALVLLPVLAATVLSHHLTILLFIPILAILVAGGFLGQSYLSTDSVQPRTIPLVLLVLGGVVTWINQAGGFLSYLYSFAQRTLFEQGIFASETGGGRVLFEFGTSATTHTTVQAARSLVSVDGIYYILLAAMVLAGAAVALRQIEEYERALPLFAVGVLGSVVLLPIPVVAIVNRFRLPLSFFAAFVVGVMVASAQSNDFRGKTTFVIVAVVLLVATTAPFVAGDDLYGVHAGPNLYEVRDTPEQQTTFSQEELAELRATSRFVERSDTTVSTFWITREAFNGMGIADVRSPRVERTGIRAQQPFVYRERWVQHQVGTETNVVGTIVFSRSWLDRSVAGSNKVYTTGSVGVLTGRSGGSMWLNGTVRNARYGGETSGLRSAYSEFRSRSCRCSASFGPYSPRIAPGRALRTCR